MINTHLHSVFLSYSCWESNDNHSIHPAKTNKNATQQQQQPRGAQLFPSDCPAPSLAPTAETTAAAAVACNITIGPSPTDTVVLPNDNRFEAKLSEAVQNSLNDL